MATRPPIPPPAATPPARGKGKTLLHGVGGRNPLVLLAGGGALVVVVVALAHRSGSSSGQGATTAANPAATYDSSMSDYQNYFQDQLNNLETQIGNLNKTPTGGTTTPAPVPLPKPGVPSAHPIVSGKTPVPAPTPAPAPKPASHTQQVVTVTGGDTLSSIAAKFGETWQQVWAYNLQAGVRSAADQATLKKRGPNLIYRGEQIYIPKK